MKNKRKTKIKKFKAGGSTCGCSHGAGVYKYASMYKEGGKIPETGTILTSSTGVPHKVLEYDPKFGGRVKIERADEYGKGKSKWYPLSKYEFKNGGKIGEIKNTASDIKKIEHLVDYSVRGNSNQLPYDGRMIEDHMMFLNDKDFFEKYGDKIGTHPDEDDFDENGRMEEFRITDQYFITFKDDSEITLDFDVDGNLLEVYVNDEDSKDKNLAKKYESEFNKEGWDIDITELQELVGTGKFKDGGILLMSEQDRIALILKTLKDNKFYSEKQLNFISLAPLVNLIISQYLIYDENNPIVTRFNEAVYFHPDERHLKREGLDISQIEYATHFITGGKSNERTFDKSKYDAIQFLIPMLKSPDVQRLHQKGDKEKNRKEAIVYAKEISINKGICVSLIAEISKDGVIRAVTFLPKDRCGYIEKQKASNVWSDAPVIFSPRNETPPSDSSQTMSTGGSIRHSSTSKGTKNTDNNANNLKLYNIDSQEVVNYDIVDGKIFINDNEVSDAELYGYINSKKEYANGG
ncbi:MAG TPA: hypothetical protein VN026_13620, partial [Bacteroidia bacterium]|nr:hypothetical protein [Bacteroidia bacterium]